MVCSSAIAKSLSTLYLRNGPFSIAPACVDAYVTYSRAWVGTTTGRSERFSTKLEQIHARNFLKESVEHALLANLKPFVKHLPNTCLFKNP